jgi:hypothetical protein
MITAWAHIPVARGAAISLIAADWLYLAGAP